MAKLRLLSEGEKRTWSRRRPPIDPRLIQEEIGFLRGMLEAGESVAFVEIDGEEDLKGATHRLSAAMGVLARGEKRIRIVPTRGVKLGQAGRYRLHIYAIWKRSEA